MSKGLRPVELLHIDASMRQPQRDAVIEETPIALLYNGDAFAVMMATPCDLDDFALGFALSEGIVATPSEFRLVDSVRSEDGITLHCAIPQVRFDALGARRRNLEGRSGCGLCGVESLQAAVRPIARVGSDIRLDTEAIRAGLDQLAQRQPLNAASGGVHAAAFAAAGEDMLIREDVGRHNALDKVIGAMARATPARQASHGFLIVTSRASYEIVHKAAQAGIALIVAISAPTDLAIRLAEQAGITLVAFARGDSMNVYTHPGRVA